ncbi:Uncharacterized protein TCM_043754 [Theobroma cacao]|uniref:Uncharacterized protein n=1 Tax=Theobroma cacao TaxID=3641 RepID=A0A061FW85_THECC|nr:Uncharacterized protein TCM_043754 [Theobroma cacao]
MREGRLNQIEFNRRDVKLMQEPCEVSVNISDVTLIGLITSSYKCPLRGLKGILDLDFVTTIAVVEEELFKK